MEAPSDSYVEADSTDHIYFYCGDCAARLKVESVSTDRSGNVHGVKGFVKVTRIHLKCLFCKKDFVRKFYWNGQEP